MSPVRHSFVSPKTDPADTTLVRPSDWNADHEEGVEVFGAVGDGTTDDTTAVQAAIDSGGYVRVPPGTYLVSASLVAVSGLTVEGCGPSSIIKLADDSDTHLFSIPDGTSGVVLRNLKLDGNGTNQTTLDGDGDTVNVVNIISSSDITLDNVEVANACDTGIHIIDSANVYSTDITVRDSYVHTCGFQCVRTRYTDRVSLMGNHFYNWGTATAAQPCIATTYGGEARNWRIIGNHFQNVAGTQFAIETAGLGGLLDSVISGNVLDGNDLGGNGISCLLYRCTLAGNVQTNGGGTHRSGYEVGGTDIVVADNIVEEGSIAVASSLTNSRIKVRGNSITNSAVDGKGISIGNAANAVTHISVTDNTVHVSGTGSVNGILVGVYGTAGQVNHVTVRGNCVYDGTANAEGIGVQGVTGSTDIVIQGNSVHGCNQGVYIAANSNHDEVTITGNDLRGNTVAIDDNSTGGTYRINNNILADNQAHVFSGGLEVTGDRSDGTALTDLLTKLATLGIITDSTVA